MVFLRAQPDCSKQPPLYSNRINLKGYYKDTHQARRKKLLLPVQRPGELKRGDWKLSFF